MRILDRYIVRQLLPRFALGVLLFAGIIFFFSLRETLEDAQETGMSLWTMCKLLGLSCPALLTYVLPIGALFGSALLSGRMSEDGEVTAACMAGVPLHSLMRWAFGVGLLAAVGGAVVNECVAVPAQRRAEEMKDRLFAARKGGVQRHLCYVDVDDTTGEASLLVYARSFDPETGTLSDVTVVQFTGGAPERGLASFPKVVRAAEAQTDGGGKWVVRGAAALMPGQAPIALGDQVVSLGRSPEDLKGGRHPERRMSARDLRRRAEELSAEANVNPTIGRLRNGFLMELWLRLTIPLTCLPFALLGAALGAQPQGGGLSMALGLSVLTSFIYYTVLRYADTMGRAGQLPPALAAWLPAVLAMVAGVVLLSRSRS